MTTARHLTQSTKKRSVFTIATGLDSFLNMAVNLAISFERHNSTSDIDFYIVTDRKFKLPSKLRKTRIVDVSDSQIPKGFSAKLLIPELSQSPQSLFVDADCLITRNVEEIFSIFSGLPVGIFGEVMTEGERFGDVKGVCAKMSIPWLPNFNGGVYYVDNDFGAKEVFAAARALEPAYDDIGFVRLRGQPNEEMLVGAVLAKNGIYPVANGGNYYADFQWWPKLEELNILEGRCRLANPPAPDQLHQSKYPATKGEPIIVHFLGHHVELVAYQRSTVALRCWAHGFPLPTELSYLATIHSTLIEKVKAAFRRPYHYFFGFRKIRKSKSRLIIE